MAAESLVRAPRPLSQLLREPTPSAVTRGGEHRFEAAELRALASLLPEWRHGAVLLPMRFWVSHELPGDAYTADDTTIRVLRLLGVTQAPVRDGRLWISEALARAFALRWPSLVQFVMT